MNDDEFDSLAYGPADGWRWEPGDAYVDFGPRTYEEAELLAADIVPRTLKADARKIVGFMDLVERNALKPPAKRRQPKGRKT